MGEIESPDKHPIPCLTAGTKFQISTNDQNPNPNRLGHWKLEIEIWLEFGAWLLEFHPRMAYA
jgi:hypothetical protein